MIIVYNNPYFFGEGLFGQVLLFIFELLPKLSKINDEIYFNISSILYGNKPDYTIIPGILINNNIDTNNNINNINNNNNNSEKIYIDIEVLRKEFKSKLTNNFHDMNKLFFKFFSIHLSILNLVDELSNKYNISDCLGLHYRGTDKNKYCFDTDPITHDQFIFIISDYLISNPHIKNIFLCSDEDNLYKKLKLFLPNTYKIINHSPKVFFKNNTNNNLEKAISAMVDSLLLSRCKIVLKCQSALSAFAKIFNPDLEIYRVTCCKLFSDVPYFPEAYIPKYKIKDDSNIILQNLMNDIFRNDWTK